MRPLLPLAATTAVPCHRHGVEERSVGAEVTVGHVVSVNLVAGDDEVGKVHGGEAISAAPAFAVVREVFGADLEEAEVFQRKRQRPGRGVIVAMQEPGLPGGFRQVVGVRNVVVVVAEPGYIAMLVAGNVLFAGRIIPGVVGPPRQLFVVVMVFRFMRRQAVGRLIRCIKCGGIGLAAIVQPHVGNQFAGNAVDEFQLPAVIGDEAVHGAGEVGGMAFEPDGFLLRVATDLRVESGAVNIRESAPIADMHGLELAVCGFGAFAMAGNWGRMLFTCIEEYDNEKQGTKGIEGLFHVVDFGLMKRLKRRDETLKRAEDGGIMWVTAGYRRNGVYRVSCC